MIFIFLAWKNNIKGGPSMMWFFDTCCCGSRCWFLISSGWLGQSLAFPDIDSLTATKLAPPAVAALQQVFYLPGYLKYGNANCWPSHPGDFKNQHLLPHQQVSKTTSLTVHPVYAFSHFLFFMTGNSNCDELSTKFLALKC